MGDWSGLEAELEWREHAMHVMAYLWECCPWPIRLAYLVKP